VLAALAAIAVTVLAVVTASAGTPFASTPSRDQPNVLLIVTDDQRWDMADRMPVVRHQLIDRGVTFRNAFVSNPLCCPSRSTILTGDYSHTTGVYRQIAPFGAFGSFRDSSTLATWLDDAGYTTGMFGKYLDAYQQAALAGYVPPGWDRWVAFVHSSYYSYGLTIDGRTEVHGDDPATDYSTDVLGDAAVRFVDSAPPEAPLFLEFAPAAPHDPAVVPPTPELDLRGLPTWRPPSYDEADVSDKPGYVRALRPLDAERARQMDELRRRQYQTLRDVDDQIANLLGALDRAGRLGDTLIIFTTDNGLLLGEHRWTKKEVPYEEAIRVPMVVRYDPLGHAPRTDDHMVLNLDIAPTIVEATGAPAPGMDGRSLLPLLGDASIPWRHDFLIEHMRGTNPVPTYCGVRTGTEKYVRYETGERELYELSDDPHELTNVADDPAHRDDVSRLSRRLDELCDPPPPGMDEGGSVPAAVAVAGLAGVLAIAGRWSIAGRRRRRPG
jgi:N-acetylglucosamine-6-sulfatase